MESKGMYRVGLGFNPSGNSRVDDMKIAAAQAIDSLQDLVDQGDEAGRCAAIAQTKFEEAAMWAVKAITKPSRIG
jgi:hypothetical protein